MPLTEIAARGAKPPLTNRASRKSCLTATASFSLSRQAAQKAERSAQGLCPRQERAWRDQSVPAEKGLCPRLGKDL